MVSAVVVHKTGDKAPGLGFTRFARELGRSVRGGSHGELEFWAIELERCFDFWGPRSPTA